MEKPLNQQYADGMEYFRKHSDRIGSKQWNLFVRTVLRPYSNQLLATLSQEERQEIQDKLDQVKGGYLVGL